MILNFYYAMSDSIKVLTTSRMQHMFEHDVDFFSGVLKNRGWGQYNIFTIRFTIQYNRLDWPQAGDQGLPQTGKPAVFRKSVYFRSDLQSWLDRSTDS